MGAYRAGRLALLPRKESWQRVPGGIWMRITPDDFMDQGFLLGNYEPVLAYLVTRFVRPGDVCVDVGAHEGYITLQLAKAVRDKGRVIAIDPDHRAIAKLSENCARNSFQHVIICNLALGDVAGICEFSFSKQLGYSSRFPNDVAKPLIRSIANVDVKPLDQLLPDLGITSDRHELSFVKIDAEGSEPLVIKGMYATLGQFKPVLWIEVNPESLGSAELSASSIQDPLLEHGYDLYRFSIKRDSLLRIRLSIIKVVDLERDIQHCEDVLAVPRNSQYYGRLAAWLDNPSIWRAKMF